MKKSNPTPKEMIKKRAFYSKIMRIPKGEGNFDNKENEIPIFINNKKSKYKVHDRDVKETHKNPFAIPTFMGTVSSKKKPTKSEETEPFIMNEPKTVCDIDSTFFNVIEGRPLRQLLDHNVYMKNIREITLTKANAAYLKEKKLIIDSKHTYETEEYNKIYKFYKETNKNFVNFMKEDYENSTRVQEYAQKVALILSKMVDQLEAYSFEYVRLRNLLSSLASNLDTLYYYARFLNSMAPRWWKMEFDHAYKKKHGFVRFESQNIEVISTESVATIDEYKISLANHRQTPHIFFTNPIQLVTFYEDIGRQCLNYMKIEAYNSNVCKSVIKTRDLFKADMQLKIADMEEYVKTYENKIDFYEQRGVTYQKLFNKLLLSEFQDLYSSFDNSKLFTCVQYVHTQIFGGLEDPKDSVVTLMSNLESLYLKLSSNLDSFDQVIVKAATNELFSKDIKAMSQACQAQRVLKECEIFKSKMYISFEPSRPRRYTCKKYEKVKAEELQ